MPDSIREKSIESVKGAPFEEMQKREVIQPDWTPPAVPQHQEVDKTDIYGLKIPEQFDTQPDDSVWNEDMLNRAGMLDTESTAVPVTQNKARNMHLDEVKNLENPNNVGMTKVKGQELFMPFKSIEGRGKDKSMSEFEIGYGIKIPSKWISPNRNDWPTIQGVPVDLWNGITVDQASQMSKDILDKSYVEAESRVGKEWKALTERERSFWADLVYNGGAGAVPANPNAMKAMKKGHTAEAMIKAGDYIKAGGKAYRGLLNRRLSMYNQAALTITGAPVVESYEVKKGETVIKFAYGFNTKKVSDAFAKKVNGNKNQHSFKVDIDKTGTYKADKNYNFK